MKKNEEIEGRSLSGPPDGLMALGRVKNWCTNTQGAAKHNRFNFDNWKEIKMKKWHQYKGGQRQQWKISAPRHEIYFSESESGWWNRWSMQRSQYERQGLLVGWPTNQDNKRANSVHLTPCNSHLDELTNIYKCKTWASDAVTWYTQVRKEGTLSLIWHPINIVQIEYPWWEVHMLLSGHHCIGGQHMRGWSSIQICTSLPWHFPEEYLIWIHSNFLFLVDLDVTCILGCPKIKSSILLDFANKYAKHSNSDFTPELRNRANHPKVSESRFTHFNF